MGHKKSFLNRAIILYNEGRFKESIIFFNRSLRYEDDSMRSLDGRAACHEKLKMFGEAQNDARQMLSLNPRDPRPYLRLGKLLKKNFDASIDSILRIYDLGLSRCQSKNRLYSELERQRKLASSLIFEKENLLSKLPKEILNRIFQQIPHNQQKEIHQIVKISLPFTEILGEKDKNVSPINISLLRITNLFIQSPKILLNWQSFEGKSIIFNNCRFSPPVLALILGDHHGHGIHQNIKGLKFIHCSLIYSSPSPFLTIYRKRIFDTIVVINSLEILSILHGNAMKLYTNHIMMIGEEKEFLNFGLNSNSLFCSFDLFISSKKIIRLDRLTLIGERPPPLPSPPLSLMIPPHLKELLLCCSFVDHDVLLSILQPSIRVLIVLGELEGGGGIIELMKFIKKIFSKSPKLKILGFPSLKGPISSLPVGEIRKIEEENNCWILTNEQLCKGIINRNWMVPKIF